MEIKIKIDAPGLTEAITKLASAISQSGNVSQIKVKAEQTEVKTPAEETLTTPPVEEEEEAKAAPAITIETVRVKLAELAQAGKQAQVKALITSLGANKLSDVPQDKYAELLEKASEL